MIANLTLDSFAVPLDHPQGFAPHAFSGLGAWCVPEQCVIVHGDKDRAAE